MAQNNKPIFADGFGIKSPHENAPDFVKLHLPIKVDEAIKFLKEYEKDGWVNLDLKKSSKGNLYWALNQFDPKKQDEEDLPAIDFDSDEVIEEDSDEIDPDNIF